MPHIVSRSVVDLWELFGLAAGAGTLTALR
jgi:hypothetical protein